MHQWEPPHHRQWSCPQRSVQRGSSPWTNGCYGPHVKMTACCKCCWMSHCSAAHSVVHPWGCAVHTGCLGSHLHSTSTSVACGAHTYWVGSSLTWAQSHVPVTNTTPALNNTCCSLHCSTYWRGMQKNVGPKSCTSNITSCSLCYKHIPKPLSVIQLFTVLHQLQRSSSLEWDMVEHFERRQVFRSSSLEWDTVEHFERRQVFNILLPNDPYRHHAVSPLNLPNDP